MSFTTVQVDYLDANKDAVEYRQLFELTLMGQTFRLAESDYPVTAAGHTWTPAIQVIEAGEVSRGDAFEAVPAEYVIAGLPANAGDAAQKAFDDMALAVMQTPEQWFGGTVHRFLQLIVDGEAVGPPISLHKGWLRDVVPEEIDSTARFRLRVESIFARRNRTPLGEYTDRDQKRRSPGDRGAEFTPTFERKVVTGWPY